MTSLENLPLKNCLYVAFDTETTGLSPILDRLVELSAVKFKGDGEIISTYSTLIDPEIEIPAQATTVHGITQEMVKNQPDFRKVIPAFLEWSGDNSVIFVAHNAAFDVGFLSRGCQLLNLPVPPNPLIDTLSLSRKILTQAPNHQLRTLVEYLELNSGGYHRALADSHHVKNLLLTLFERIPKAQTWQDIIQYGATTSMAALSAELNANMAAMEKNIELLREAISTGASLDMRYCGYKITTRRVTPKMVQNNKGNIYLIAYCHTSAEDRTFRLDRIEMLEPALIQSVDC